MPGKRVKGVHPASFLINNDSGLNLSYEQIKEISKKIINTKENDPKSLSEYQSILGDNLK